MITIMSQSNYLETQSERPYITREQYEEFKHQYIFDVLKDLRYGQAFCNYFNIQNGTPLFYFRDMATCERWIEDNYIR
jgi:hypothetical protein